MEQASPIVVLTLTSSNTQNHTDNTYKLSPDEGFDQLRATWPNLAVITERIGALLSDIARYGYRLQSSAVLSVPTSQCHPTQTQYIFVHDGGAVQTEQLRDEMHALKMRVDREATRHGEEKSLWKQEHCRQSAEIKELLQGAGADRCTLAASKAEAAAQTSQLAARLDEMTAKESKLCAQMENLQKEVEQHHVAEVHKLQMQLLEAQKPVEEKLQFTQKFAPMLEEYDVLSHDDEPSAKHVRISCPGIQEEHIEIEPLPNGVGVKIHPSVGDDVMPLFSKEFQYPHSEGHFELSFEQCGLENGVLLLVLRRVQKPKFKLSRAGRSPPLRIAEDHVPQDDIPSEGGALSPSMSQVPLGTTISSNWIEPSLDAASEHSWALVHPQLPACTGEKDAVITMSPGRCLLKDSLLLAEDGQPVAVMDIEKGTRLCSLRSGSDGTLIFGVAVVRAKRLGMLRDSDIAEIQLKGQGTQQQQSNQELKMHLTTSHSTLVTTSDTGADIWTAIRADELVPHQHKMFVMQQESDLLLEVVAVKTVVQTCEVVELELEDKADAVLLQLNNGVFAAVFGSPPWHVMQIVAQEGSTQVQEEKKSQVACSSRCDPTHDQVACSSCSEPASHREQPIYRQINRPHDAHCTAWCKFYFASQGCKKGKLCEWCHNPEHEERDREQRTHRGKRR